MLPKQFTHKPCLYLVSEFSDHKLFQLIKDFASYEQNQDIEKKTFFNINNWKLARKFAQTAYELILWICKLDIFEHTWIHPTKEITCFFLCWMSVCMAEVKMIYPDWKNPE